MSFWLVCMALFYKRPEETILYWSVHVQQTQLSIIFRSLQRSEGLDVSAQTLAPPLLLGRFKHIPTSKAQFLRLQNGLTVVSRVKG